MCAGSLYGLLIGAIPGGVGVINQAIYMVGVCQLAQKAHVCMHLSELAINGMFVKTGNLEESSLPGTQDIMAILGEMWTFPVSWAWTIN